MKLLIDGRPVRSPLSGSAVFVVNLAREMIKFGIKPTVFLQSDNNKNKEINNLTDLDRIISNKNKTIENLLVEYGLNNEKLYRHQESIVHETYFARMPIAATRRISTIHDVIPLDFPKWFTWRNSYFAKKNFFRQMSKSKHVVFSSKFTQKQALIHFGGAVNSSVIQLAVSENIHKAFDSYRTDKVLLPKFANLEPYILIVGNVEPRKNIPLVAEAIKLLNDRLNLDLKLVIAGKENFNSYEILVETSRNLGKDPICLGFVSEEEKINLYQNSACHVYASKYEGFGIPPVESLLIGTPTVIAQNTSLLEITPTEKMGFDSNNSLDLADAMERNLFLSPFEDKLIDMNLMRAHFSWHRVAEEYSELYKTI
jgi:glycosyltransferase involved in cell wall biosynthesis